MGRGRYLLEAMIDEWEEESDPSVKAELLTAAVKLFFARPGALSCSSSLSLSLYIYIYIYVHIYIYVCINI